jgi:hypothetical protein
MSHKIKDKEIPRWRPLRKLPRLAASKLSPKRILILVIALACLLLFLAPSYIRPITVLDGRGGNDEVVSGRPSRTGLNSTLNLEDLLTGKRMAIFVTSHDLHESAGLMLTACEMAAAGNIEVFLMFLGRNSAGSVRFFFEANQFDKETCPLIYYDGRHEYSSLAEQLSATEGELLEAISKLDPLFIVYLDNEEAWLLHSLERVVYWRRPTINLIQLKRRALSNLRWMATLSVEALAGILNFHSVIDK